MVRHLLLLLLATWSCSSEDHQGSLMDANVPTSRRDSDHDGLCDATEIEAGTDPDLADSDGDALPDGLEQVLGYSPLDDSSPSADRQIEATETTTHLVRFNVEGEGQSFQGVFLWISSPFSTPEDASSLFSGALAQEALPPDNVRSFLPKTQVFETVTGATRLSFELTFDLSAVSEETCTVAHPFAYGIAELGGGLVEQQKFLLVIPGKSTKGQKADFCPPANCI